MALGGLRFRKPHWSCHAPIQRTVRGGQVQGGLRQALARRVHGRRTPVGLSSSRASPEYGLSTATDCSFSRLTRRAGGIRVRRFTSAGSPVPCLRKCSRACRSENRKRFRRMNEGPNKITAPNAGGRRQLPIRTRSAARVGEFCRYPKGNS